MNKKVLIGILVVLVAVLGVGGYLLLSDKGKTDENEKTPTNDSSENDNKGSSSNDDDKGNVSSTDKKAIVVYYSATGSTKKVAEKIAENLKADLFEIEPVEEYTSEDLNYGDANSRVSREHGDESLRDVKLKNTKVDNWDAYDTVLIGYPIWWGNAAWPVNTFVKANDFSGKTVIPFCTSASSGLGQSGDLLAKETNSGNWQNGHRFSSSASSSDIKAWTDSLK